MENSLAICIYKNIAEKTNFLLKTSIFIAVNNNIVIALKALKYILNCQRKINYRQFPIST